jgi:hypothetical protein
MAHALAAHEARRNFAVPLGSLVPGRVTAESRF